MRLAVSSVKYMGLGKKPKAYIPIERHDDDVVVDSRVAFTRMPHGMSV